jgi:hypothetical protein
VTTPVTIPALTTHPTDEALEPAEVLILASIGTAAAIVVVAGTIRFALVVVPLPVGIPIPVGVPTPVGVPIPVGPRRVFRAVLLLRAGTSQRQRNEGQQHKEDAHSTLPAIC